MPNGHPLFKRRSKQILATTDANIARIGEEVGYEDPASFRRLFKRKSG
jgi:AraC-like DNA-binding protein